MSGNSEVGVNGESVGFLIKLYLVKGIVGGYSEDFGDIQFGEEVLSVVNQGYNRGGLQGIILSCIYNK